MNTQTFELQAVTDEDLQAADGGIFGKVVGKAFTKVLPKVTIARAARTGATGILMTGADDFIAKPFNIREVLARVKALLRRSTAVSPDQLSFGDLRLNGAERR
jgi:hypothetical protein